MTRPVVLLHDSTANVIPFRTPRATPEDWMTDDTTPVAVHLVSTRFEVNAVMAYLQHPTHPQVIQTAARKWLEQIKEQS